MASSCATYFRDHGGLKVLCFDWIAHTDGSFTSVQHDSRVDGMIVGVVTDPLSPAPTDLYDITLTDENGLDVTAAGLQNRSTTNSERWTPSDPVPVSGYLTLNIANNSVNGAMGHVKVFVNPGERS